MAFSWNGGSNQTVMQDGLSSKRTKEAAETAAYNAKYNGTAAQQAVQRDYQLRLDEEKWAAEQEAKKRAAAEAEAEKFRKKYEEQQKKNAEEKARRESLVQQHQETGVSAQQKNAWRPPEEQQSEGSWQKAEQQTAASRQQTVSSGGLTIPTKKASQYSDITEEDINRNNEELAAAQQQKAAAETPISYTPNTIAEATDTGSQKTTGNKERTWGYKRAEDQAPIVYTGGEISNPKATTGAAAQTKSVLEAEEEEPQWKKDLAAANAEDARRRQAVTTANQEAAIARMNAGPQYDQGSIQAMRQQALQEIAQREANAIAASRRAGYEYNPPATQSRWAGQSTGNTVQPQRAVNPDTLQWANDYAASRRAGYEYTTFDQKVASDPELTAQYNEIYRRVLDNGTAQNAEEARAYAVNAMAPELGYNPKGVLASSIPATYYQPLAETENAQTQYEDRAKAYQSAYDKAKASGMSTSEAEAAGVAAAQEVYARQHPQRRTGTSTETPTTGGSTTGRSGVNAALEDIMNGQSAEDFVKNYGASKRENYEATPQSIQNAVKVNESKGVESTATASKESGTTTSSKNPKGTTYFDPSYKQGGKGVKLPYKSGGYTEAELMAAGNKAYGTKYGANVYEGYYQAPNGKYYPVDQEKAAYYVRNGYSYDGWEEPMRDYYNTFGTFYGYRPDWKTAGRTNSSGGSGVSYSYSPRSSAVSAAGYGSGRSYGRGTTPSNGLYWNGNTSWSI